MSNVVNLEELLSACIDLAQRAGVFVKSGFESTDFSSVDVTTANPSTQLDKHAQELIVASLRRHFPSVKVCGEESGLESPESKAVDEVDSKLVSERLALGVSASTPLDPKHVVVWVDPLDGTKRLLHGDLEAVTVCIGIALHGAPVAGVVYSVHDGRAYWGVCTDARKAVYGFKEDPSAEGAPEASPESARVVLASLHHLTPDMTAIIDAAKPSQVLSRGGGARKGLTVLKGEAQAWMHPAPGLHTWDTCAVHALFCAANCQLTDMYGGDVKYDSEERHLLARGLVATRSQHSSFLAGPPGGPQPLSQPTPKPTTTNSPVGPAASEAKDAPAHAESKKPEKSAPKVSKEIVKELFDSVKQGLQAVKAVLAKHNVHPKDVVKSNRTILHESALEGDLEIVKFLVLEKGLEPTGMNASGRTTLHYCGATGNVEVFKWLVSQGVGIHANDVGRTPLHASSQRGKIDTVRFIIENQLVAPTVEDHQGLTPFHAACERNKLDVVQYYVEECKLDANLQTTYHEGFRPIHVAARGGAMKVLKWLVSEAGPHVDPMSKDARGYTAVQSAAETGQIEAVRFLIELMGLASSDPGGAEAEAEVEVEAEAEAEAEANLVQTHEEKKADDGAASTLLQNVLKIAVERDHVKLVEVLVEEYRADYTIPEYMYFAVMHPSDSNVHRLQTVLRHIPPTYLNEPHPYFGLTALQLAGTQKSVTQKKRIKTGAVADAGVHAEQLTEDQKQAHAQKEYVQTCLLPKIEGLLVSFGATPFLQISLNRNRVPPTGGLQHSVYSNPSYLPLELMKPKPGEEPDVDDISNDPLHRTVLHFVCSHGPNENDTFRWFNELDNHHAAYDIQDDEGWGPLHEAALATKMPSLRRLLQLKEDGAPTARRDLLDMETYAGRTALELVEQHARYLETRPAGSLSQSPSYDADEDQDELGGCLSHILCCDCLFNDDTADQDSTTGQQEALELPSMAEDKASSPAKKIQPEEEVDPKALWEVHRFLQSQAATPSAWRFWHVHLPRYMKFAVYMLAYGLVFPLVLVWQSLGSKLSETLLKIEKPADDQDGEMPLAQKLLVMLGSLSFAIFIPIALIYADADRSVLQFFILGVALFGLVFLGISAYKARLEPRFVRALYPHDDYEIRNTNPDRRRENMLAIFSMLLEFMQLNAFSFLPKVESWSVDVDGNWTGLAVPFKIALFDFDLGVGGQSTIWASAGLTLALVFLWYLVYSFIGMAVVILRSGRPRDRPPLRQEFPFIQPNFYTKIPNSDFVVPLLTQTLFLPIVGQLFSILDCTKEADSGEFFLSSSFDTPDIDPVQCWEGTHLVFAVLAIIALFFYVPTSVFVGVFFLDGESDGQIGSTGYFSLIASFAELLLSSFSTVFVAAIVAASNTDNNEVAKWLALVLTCLVCLSLSIINAMVCPCQHIRSINLLSSTLYAMASWTAVCAMLAQANVNLLESGQFDYFPYIMFVGGWGALLAGAAVVYRDPVKYPFVRHIEFVKVVPDVDEAAGDAADSSRADADKRTPKEKYEVRFSQWP